MALYAVVTRYVPEENERRLAARPAHRENLMRLLEQGKLINAGPFADGTGALLVYDVADETELFSILSADPYPADSFTVEIAQGWNALFEFPARP